MRTELYWIDGPWPGRLAIMPRPRGGDWLEDEIGSWRQSGVDLIVSLLLTDEAAEMELAEEADLCRKNGIEFVSFPIVDREVPSSSKAFSDFLTQCAEQLVGGKKVAVHCRQGIGRAGLTAICLLVISGLEEMAAVNLVSSARGCPVPETLEQRRWIARFAQSAIVPRRQ